MCFKLLVMVLLIKIVVAKIKLDMTIDANQEVEFSYSGEESRVITDSDIDLFKLWDENRYRAAEQYMGKRPNDVYLRSPTPWGDLYKRYNWPLVHRVWSVKSAKVTNKEKGPTVVMTQDGENFSNITIKVNTGLSRMMQNSLTTSWSNEQSMGATIDVGVQGMFGMGLSYTATMGRSEAITKSETIGTTSNMEVELKPGQAVTAVLTATASYLEVEVVYKAWLTGTMVLNYYPTYRGHHFQFLEIGSVMNAGNIKNEVTMTETIRMNQYTEGKLKVYDKINGLML